MAQIKPLRGIRVLSLALNLPGPAALMRLKALGASCTKLESPAGDPMNAYSKPAYKQMHEGVKIVTADLKTERGMAK
ncbi:MAG: CoA transferase, partial [Brachymonas sp.]